MSDYISDTPQTRYTHVTNALHTLNARLAHARGVTEASRKRPTQDFGKSERASSVHDVPETCTERVRNVFDALVTHVTLLCNVWGIRPKS